MTPLQALEILDSLVARMALPRADHVHAQQCSTAIREALQRPLAAVPDNPRQSSEAE